MTALPTLRYTFIDSVTKELVYRFRTKYEDAMRSAPFRFRLVSISKIFVL